jgi:hypothetical protein
MKVPLVLVTLAAPAFAEEPAGTLPAPMNTAPSGPAAAAPGIDPAPAPAPAVDPAYGDRPDPRAPSQSVEDDRHLRGVRHGREIVVRYYPDRPRDNVRLLAATAGAGALFGLVGLYFHLDWRSTSSAVAADTFTGRTWSDSHQEQFEQAQRSSTIAGVMYGIGGALLLTTAIAYIVTEPKMETRIIHPHTNAKPMAMVAPIQGGALVGGGWTF